MFRIFSPHHSRNYSRVSSILSPISSYIFTAASVKKPKTPSSSSLINHTNKDLSPLKFTGIAETVLSNCSHVRDTNKGENFTSLSVKDHFLRLSNISPEIVRRFWRVSVLNPNDVLEILLGFEYNRGNCEVESLWGIFIWANGQNRNFVHVPQSCKIMASMLVQNGYFREAEYLLSRKESRRILSDCEEIFNNLIEGYLGEFELDKGFSIYEGMRRLRLVPSFSSYKAILDYLVELNETQLMYDVYLDMINTRIGKSVEEIKIHENVIRMLCVDGKIQEARALVKKITSVGIKPSNLVVNVISSGYCDKKDYDDLLSYLAEAKISPDVNLGNKILFSLCSDFGLEQAIVFLRKLEEINFIPDEITFGILVGFSCREGKLKNALFHISDIFSRGLKPNVHSYNALLSGIFNEGMWMHAREVLVEMTNTGVTPNLSTYRVSLAGFCKARQFDEVKAIVSEMADRNLIKLSSSDDLLTKGFVILGLDPSYVKIKRDNDKGLSKAEFFDDLGNGLYLDTDLDEYDKKITRVLEDAMVVDFNSIIIEKNRRLDSEITRMILDEMSRWGQELTFPALSSLLNRPFKGPFSVEIIDRHLSVMSKSTYKLDLKTLNILVRTYCESGFNFKARSLLDGMIRRGYAIESSTFSALLFGMCEKDDLRSFRYCYELARKLNWSPEVKDGNTLLRFLCKNKWFHEALELFEYFFSISPRDKAEAFFRSLIEGLCSQGFTSTACALMTEFSNNGIFLSVYSHLVSGFCREKKFLEAFDVFENIISSNLSPPVGVFTPVISRLCKLDVEKAVELKDICLKHHPDALIHTNCALIKGLCESGGFKKAINLFEEVLPNGLILDVDVCNALIGGVCGENYNFKKVGEFLGFMIRNNLNVSISSYSKMMIRSTRDEENFRLAIRLKELMLQISDLPRLFLYNISIFHVSSLRKGFLIDEIISCLRKRGLNFDDVTYDYVIRGYSLCGDVSRSLYYLRSMIIRGFKPTDRSLRKVISRLCENGDIGVALDLSREMELRGWIFCSVIQNDIVYALLDKGKIREADEFLDNLTSKDLIPNRVRYDNLIERFYRHGRMDKSIELLNIMLKKGSDPNSTSYGCIIRGLCESFEWDKALDYYAEMSCRDIKPGLITSEILVRGLCECGRSEEGEMIFKSMIEIGETPRREVFESLIRNYRAEKNVEKASEILKIMQERGYAPDFDTHWNLVSNLSDSSRKVDGCEGMGFLSSLLSGFGGKKTTRTAG